MSGPWSYVSTLHYELLEKAYIIVERNQPHRRTLSRFTHHNWERIRHQDCGGITNGQFWYGYPKDVELGLIPPATRRTLTHIVSSATKQFQVTVDAPVDQRPHNSVQMSNQGILATGLMPIDSPLEQYICPSVFSKTGWCRRKLSTRELSDSFDQSFSVAEQAVVHGIKPSFLPFLNAVPNKVVQHIARRIFISSILSDSLDTPVTDNEVSPIIEVPLTIEEKYLKSVKADDALVETHIWDNRVLSIFPHVPHTTKTVGHLNILRRLFLKAWKSKVWASFFGYLRKQYGSDWQGSKYHNDTESELYKDIEAFVNCSYSAHNADWFEWGKGSTLFFWRWQHEYRSFVRDGLPYWVHGPKPRSKRPQPEEPDQCTIEKIREKIGKVRERSYIAPGFVKSLIRFFTVPKGDSDVRVVYDATSSGFNKWVWAPSFGLPTIDSMLRSVNQKSWLGDLDIAEQFLNFPLCKLAQLYAGVDLTPYFPEEKTTTDGKFWQRWTRCLMGAKPSPYQAIRSMLWAEDIIRGDRQDQSNPFRWDSIQLNLPGDRNYNPALPWVAKLRRDGELATDFYIYVDDVRVTAPSEADMWEAIRVISSKLSYLGIQDATRKRRPPSRRPGAWAGSMVYLDDKYIGVYIDHAKWVKTKTHLAWLRDQINRCEGPADAKKGRDFGINHKELEKRRGFLVYVSRTYPSMVPYLKGIHQTLDGWREGRDSDGWKLTVSELKAAKDSGDQIDYIYPTTAPKSVLPASRLDDDLSCLEQLFHGDNPVVRTVRSKLVYVARYGFGDASGGGFGSSIALSKGLRVRHGIWGRDSNKLSSNYKELSNLVEAVEAEVETGSLRGSELFLFTDNAVAENCFFKGTSQSRLLFNLILRLRKAEHKAGIKLNVIHVAGTRMIAQGTDGLSRGNLVEGVMSGQDILSFVPLHQSAFERSKDLSKWIRSWVPSVEIDFLSVEDWFELGHGIDGGARNRENVWVPTYRKSCKIWSPAPAAAAVAMEELTRARHMDPYQSHIVIIPRLMTYQWRKSLSKASDTLLYIPAGNKHFWPSHMHEPLILAILTPFRHQAPWQVRKSPRILELENQLRHLWGTSDGVERNLLRQFWQ